MGEKKDRSLVPFMTTVTAMKDGYLTEEDIRLMKKHIRIGDRLNCKIYTSLTELINKKGSPGEKATACRILRKHRYFAETTKGDMQWKMLAIWNRELVEQFRKKDAAERRIKYGYVGVKRTK